VVTERNQQLREVRQKVETAVEDTIAGLPRSEGDYQLGFDAGANETTKAMYAAFDAALSAPEDNGGVEEAVEVLAKRSYRAWFLAPGTTDPVGWEEASDAVKDTFYNEAREVLAAIQPFLGSFDCWGAAARAGQDPTEYRVLR
jgi:hypothetical protein